MPDQKDHSIWNAFGRALRAEPRDHLSIRGASGIDHAIEAIAVDDKTKRVIVVSAEPDPRTAALMQVDIQATMLDTHVLVARPIAFDFAMLARQFATQLNLKELNFTKLGEEFKKYEGQESSLVLENVLGGIFNPVARAFKNVTLPPMNQIMALVQQLALLDWPAIFKTSTENPSNLIVPLTNLLTLDTMAIDLQHGVCPVPLYELTEPDWEMLLSGTRIDLIEQRMKELGIFQYFFPPPDQIALGVIDRSSAGVQTVQRTVELAPDLGHPLGEPELVSGIRLVPQMIDELQAQGLLVEGETGLEITPSGITARSTVKFRPREGLVSKLIQRFSVNVSVSPKDLLPPR